MMLAASVLSSLLAAAGAPPVPSPAFFEAHREKFLAKLPAGSIAVLHAAGETAADARADSFRQDSAFWYLTGLEEPNAVAVFVPGAPATSRYLLFVAPRDFAAEQWTGWRTGVEGAKKDYGAGQARPIGDFWERFPPLAASARSLYSAGGGDREFQRKLLEAWTAGNAKDRPPRPAADAATILDPMRLVKDPLEQDLLREASRISADAHRAAMARAAAGKNEWDLKAAMVATCLSRGAARMAYPPIVASGKNSVILHYERDDKRLEDGEILVNDTGCEYRMYAADVTRTYPVSGRFSADQRAIYEIVLAAQAAGLAAIRPGIPIKDVHNATVEVVVDGLLKLGILSGDRAEIIKTRAYQKFYPHGSSHWIGLNVHDVGDYGNPPGVERLERYGKAEALLAPGMALTVEPGIYIAERSTQDPRWWNIGVRIEDTVLVTASGMECLSCGAPRAVADVEKAIAEGRQAPGVIH
jgi:Xaa-Pro aminopeptidase